MKFKKIENKKLPKLENGEAKDITEFIDKIIKPQFENRDVIKKIHNTLIEYLDMDNPTFFLRLYGSFVKEKYDLLRRGYLVEYSKKMRIGFCDNTFTLLFTGMKLQGLDYDIKDLKELFEQKELVVGFGQTSEERELSYYSNKGAIRADLNAKGWYQAHIKPTGYGYDNDVKLNSLFPNPERENFDNDENIYYSGTVLNNEEVKIIKAHFLRLIHPFNSFLVPKRNHLKYNGKNLGEEDFLINQVKEYIKQTFTDEYKIFDEMSIKYEKTSSNNNIYDIKWKEAEFKETEKTDKKININIDNDDPVIKLDRTLKSIGKEVFASILYPELIKNINITSEEIANKYEKYNEYTTKKSRLSSAKTIFKNGEEIEALKNIYESKKIDKKIKEKISSYLND